MSNVFSNASSILESLTVLFVEDDQETRDELEMILSLCVKKIVSAKNGREGLELYQQVRPDIVISDIQMPEMNGLSMSAAIKKLTPEQNIIIISAHNDVEFLFRALELDIDYYVTKPIRVESLLDKMALIAGTIANKQRKSEQLQLLEHYQRIVDSQNLMLRLNGDFEILYANQAFCALTGYSADPPPNNKAVRLLDFLELKPSEWHSLKSQVESMPQCQIDLKIRTQPGSYQFVNALFSHLDEKSAPHDYIVLMSDATSLYDNIAQLSLDIDPDLDTQRRYWQEFERISISTSLICLLDTQGYIVSANSNFCKRLNCTQEQLKGTQFSELIIEDLDFETEYLQKALNQKIFSVLLKIKAKSSQSLHLFSSLFAALYNQNKEVDLIMVRSQELTQSAELSSQLLQSVQLAV